MPYTKPFKLTKQQELKAFAAAEARLLTNVRQKEIRNLQSEQKIMDSPHPQIVGIKQYLNFINRERYS